MKNGDLKPEDFEGVLDLKDVIVIPPKTDICIQVVFNDVEGMAEGKVHMRTEQHIMFTEEECFLFPSGQFGKILSKMKARLIEKGVTDDKKGRPETKDPSIH